MKILVICPFPEGVAASQRLKYEQYFDMWEKNNFSVTVSPFCDLKLWNILYKKKNYVNKVLGVAKGYRSRFRDLFQAPNYDLVYVHMWVTPLGTSFFERLLRLRARRLVYDLEDNVHIGYPSGIETNPNRRFSFLRGQDKYQFLLKNADYVIVSSLSLEEHARAVNKSGSAQYVTSSLDMQRFSPLFPKKSLEQVTIGWTGTFSSRAYLEYLLPVIQRIAYRENIKLLVIGNFEMTVSGFPYELLQWSIESEIQQLQRIDIGVYPLPLDSWVDGKSGLKAIQYMSLGIPTVASNVGMTPGIIRDGIDGFLVSDQEQWFDKLTLLIRSNDLREAMGTSARKRAVELYSKRVVGVKYLAVFQSILDEGIDL